jgi:ADP-heptose:LPS heptosyltransferase
MTHNIPTNWGPKLRAHGVRGSQIGDSIAALSVYAWLRQHAPDCYAIWQVARKHVHAAPLFYNHPLISELAISDCNEGYGPRDIQQMNSCHVRFPLMPEHPDPHVPWPNVRSFYEETFVMAGLPVELYRALPPEVRRPTLEPWFDADRQEHTIAYWPCAAYGVTQVRRSRNAARSWAYALVARLQAEGWRVIQCGHPRDYADCGDGLNANGDVRRLTFMEQIQLSTACDLVIGTDSGAGIAIGAYGRPQISLLTDHYPGHTANLTAFAPDNPNNRSLVGIGSADAISIDEVVAAIKEVTS